MRKTNQQKLNEKGITLIALVVTIVVLLILAGISLNLVLGQNGLITKAKDAKTQTEQDQVNTETAINNLADEIDSILSNSGNSGNDDEQEGSGSDNTIDLSQLKIGDYVNYTYDTVTGGYSLLATQSGYDDDQTVAQSATTLKWRVLNIDEETGKIDLVSENPSDNTVYFQGALGYNNGVYLLNDMCSKLYSNSSLGVTARSINLVDMERHLTETGLSERNTCQFADYKQYGTTYRYTSQLSYPQLYVHHIGSGIDLDEGATITQPDLIGIDPYDESDEFYTSPTTETYSTATISLTVTQTSYEIDFNEENYGEASTLLKYNNGDDTLSNADYYWVASRSTGADTYIYIADFGLRVAGDFITYSNLFRSYAENSTISDVEMNHPIRPVVSLPSELLDGTKDADGAWNLK